MPSPNKHERDRRSAASSLLAALRCVWRVRAACPQKGAHAMYQQDHRSFRQEEADLEEILSLVGTGLASYDRLVAAIQHRGRHQLLCTLHHARQKAKAWHPNVEPLHLAVTS